MYRFILLIVICTSFIFAKGWIPLSDISSKKLDVQQKGYISHWAGNVFEIYIDNDNKWTGLMRIRVTWKTNKANVMCGDVLELYQNEVQDFRTRSFSLRKCY